jgi:hypothetical protein
LTKDRPFRDHLRYLKRGGGAHLHCENLVADYPYELVNRQTKGVPHTPWQVLGHMRIAQWHILGFGRNAGHHSPSFPQAYWPAAEVLADAEQ